MGYEILDPEEFLTNGALYEDQFYEKAKSYNWARFQDKRVLVRGCVSKIVPPWVYMYITGKLAPIAKLVYFGSEHDKVIVYQAAK
jgi:hypothetical protein